MVTIAQALAGAAERLRSSGIEPAWREARLILGLAAGATPETIVGHPGRALADAAVARLDALLARRCAGEPVSRIAGVREFWSMPLALSPDTLDPRPDSETLVEAVLDVIDDRQSPLRVLDLGVGTGCLLLAILSELPNALGVGIDISEGACRTAAANAASLGFGQRCAFVVADWATPLAGSFDVIVANPPYIADRSIDSLGPEVARFDPRRALAGGPDGLDAYRQIVPGLPAVMSASGLLALEVGAGQSDAVRLMIADGGLSVLGARADLAGIERCILAGMAGKIGR